MSQNAEALDAARQVVIDKIHSRAFFHKLAEFGIRPESDDDVNTLLHIGAKAAEHMAYAEAQQPQQSQSQFAKAAAALDNLSGQPTTPAEEDQIKEAAATLAADPEIYAAAKTILQAAS